MNCPTDGTTLLMSERQGVEIDYCPECRGIWLDRGELDKILDRVQAETEAYVAPAAPLPVAEVPQPRVDDRQYENGRYADASRDSRYRDDHYHDDRRRDSRYGYKKRKSPFDFLGEIFD